MAPDDVGANDDSESAARLSMCGVSELSGTSVDLRLEAVSGRSEVVVSLRRFIWPDSDLQEVASLSPNERDFPCGATCGPSVLL